MLESAPKVSRWLASDAYPIHVETWPVPDRAKAAKGRVLILHGVQSHAGWYHDLGRTLANEGFEAHFTDRRGSGSNRPDRGHTPNTRRLLDDVAEYLAELRRAEPSKPVALAGISWGAKLAVVTAAKYPNLVDALALICPGLLPRVDVSRGERIRIALAYLSRPKKTFPIPLSDPALFTDNPDGQAFIANDPLGLRAATASLLASSFFLDRKVARVPPKVKQPSLLILADRDRIVNNPKTLGYWGRVASSRKRVIRYPEGHHTLEFDPDPTRYARDLAAWLDATFSEKLQALNINES